MGIGSAAAHFESFAVTSFFFVTGRWHVRFKVVLLSAGSCAAMGGKRKSDAHAAGTADISAFCTGKKACVSTALVPACSAVSPADGPLVAVAKVLMETLEKDIATQILAPMMPEFEFWDAQAYVPLSKGGILPLSAELYREKIAVDRELTCMTTLREVGLAPWPEHFLVCRRSQV